jgi:hypothetical protein
MNATATTQPRRKGWGILAALRELTAPRRTSTATGELPVNEHAAELGKPQRDRLAAGLPFDGSDCD